MKELTLPATIENIDVATDFIDEELEAHNCPMKAITQINIALDELFSNIARYAYPDSQGMATVRIDIDSERIFLQLADSGIEFNPLKNDDPDITASIDNRSVGGLGIFMVKKTMDEVKYEYINNQNIISIIKKI